MLWHGQGSGHFDPGFCWPWAGQGCPTDIYWWYADGDNGLVLTQEGDSGGPIFRPLSSSTVTAVGLISAGNATGIVGNTVYFADVYSEAVVKHNLDLAGIHLP